jgi:membrane-associated protease RseP (regulator of RpoE activity)
MEAARKDLVMRMAILLKDMANVSSGIKSAQLSGGWVDDAASMAGKAEKEASEIAGDGSIEALIKRPSFQMLLPHYYLELQGLVPVSNGFRLGVSSLVHDPLFIIFVDPNGLAAKLGLTNLERIEAFNGKAPKDIDDLKQMIKMAAGEDVTIKVKSYFGVESEITPTEPVNLNP